MAFDLRAWQLRAEEVLNTPIPKELIQELYSIITLKTSKTM